MQQFVAAQQGLWQVQLRDCEQREDSARKAV